MVITFFSQTVLTLALGILSNNGLIPMRAVALADTTLSDTVLAGAAESSLSTSDLSNSDQDSANAKVCPYCAEGQCDVCYESYLRYEAEFQNEAAPVSDAEADDAEADDVRSGEANIEEAVSSIRVNVARPPEPIDEEGPIDEEDLSADKASDENLVAGSDDSDASSYDGDYSSHDYSVDENLGDYHSDAYDSYPPQGSRYEPYEEAGSDGSYGDEAYGEEYPYGESNDNDGDASNYGGYDYQTDGYGGDGYGDDGYGDDGYDSGGEYGNSYEDESYRESSQEEAAGDQEQGETSDPSDLSDREAYGDYANDAEADYEPYGDDADDLDDAARVDDDDENSRQIQALVGTAVAQWASEAGDWICQRGRTSAAAIGSMWSSHSVRLPQVRGVEPNSDGRWIGCDHCPLGGNSLGVTPAYLKGFSQPLAAQPLGDGHQPSESEARATSVRPTLRLAARMIGNLGNAAIRLSATLDQMADEPSIPAADRR